jgi:hypothetical protein
MATKKLKEALSYFEKAITIVEAGKMESKSKLFDDICFS